MCGEAQRADSLRRVWQNCTLSSGGDIAYGLQLHLSVGQEAIQEGRDHGHCRNHGQLAELDRTPAVAEDPEHGPVEEERTHAGDDGAAQGQQGAAVRIAAA